MLLASGGHLVFLHCFKQSGLGFGRRSIDLISQDHIGKDRPANEPNAAPAGGLILLNHLRASDIRGHEIRRELNAIEAQPQSPGQG